ncbi:MoaD/ThiS family protein [Cryobacterium sp. TMS1-20-1]|uniref:MoaD/ThiS family protein n=1 Tax=Cryobacterium levicorallinum TaxID=995038 RepID=A0A1I2YGY6_9MICO|nr:MULTISPECIES: MoaD/ThiS family protein [Cryobacterium]TFB85955.1 MoaD/ThiS family protein [Cryobacterium levicorallinum]TFC76758.1 MoaD/ThiS family protein [Cryobacterium sp. TMS1-20-1]TFD49974.1 MoaD/ThiS family protein [Cryobacterium sp. Hh11]TFD59365.1 MoaD/ThiS family protein [Cryobacterium sp. Hh7]TFD60453.1 MoaD/ThiS family protein [Cryobacterium sp. Hh38]
MATLRFFAGAAEAAQTETATLDAGTIGELRAELGERYGSEFVRVLGLCSLLVNGARAADDTVALAPTDTVDVLPPFAGG